MSISGNLEDVTLADVLQFIYLGHSTGTLMVAAGERRAEVSFKQGQILNVWTPESLRLGEMLIEDGLICPETLVRALDQQNRERPRRSLGHVLVSCGAVRREDVHLSVARRIEATVYQLLTWTRGEFEFLRDRSHARADLALYPEDVLARTPINTERLLLNAARIFDESRRDGVEPTFAPELTVQDSEEMRWESLADEELLEPARPREEDVPPRVQVVGPEDSLLAPLRTELPEARIEACSLEDAGSVLPGEPPPLVVMDLRSGELHPGSMAELRRARPRVSIVALVAAGDPRALAEAYDAGAVSALPGAEAHRLAGCLKGLVRERGFGGFRHEVEKEARAGLQKLRRVASDLRSGYMSATMALSLMNLVGESVERAILFVPVADTLVALGAFGFSESGELLAHLTRGLQLSVAGSGALGQALSEGQARRWSLEDAELPEALTSLLGQPRSAEVALLPVVGTERVISVIYLDNGPIHRPIEDLDLLELAASQVGLAFENQLLRRSSQAQVSPPPLPSMSLEARPQPAAGRGAGGPDGSPRSDTQAKPSAEEPPGQILRFLRGSGSG